METCRGFVLAGGRSRRMGEDKGRLSWHGEPLVVYQWQRLDQLLPPAAVIGGEYRDLGVASLADRYPGQGPLGAILTALAASPAALVLAVDMPLVASSTLAGLLRGTTADAVIPRPAGGPAQPLAALYRPSAQPKLAAAFARGTRRLVEALAELEIEWRELPPGEFLSMNTPAEYAEALEH
jgi:molybdopterin-guanine dinucleotide biosynthesis protein A